MNYRRAWLAVAAFGAAAACGSPLESPAFAVGRSALAASAACYLAAAALGHKLRPRIGAHLVGLAAGLSLVALWGLLGGGDAGLHQSMISVLDLRAHVVRLPMEAGWVLLAVLGDAEAVADNLRRRAAAALTVAITAAVVALPYYRGDGIAAWPLPSIIWALVGVANPLEENSTHRAAAALAVLVLVMGVLGAAWIGLLTAEGDSSRPTAGWQRIGRYLVRAGPAVVSAWHVLSPWLSPLGASATDLLIGVLIGLAVCYCAYAAVPALTAGDVERGWVVTTPARDDWLLVALLVVGWLVVMAQGMLPAPADDGIYYYAAHQLGTRGLLPYADYFFAHPPLHVIVPGAVLGFTAAISSRAVHSVAMCIPVAASAAVAVGLWVAVRRRIGRLAALVALVVFLFDLRILRAGGTMNGANLTAAWLIAGVGASLSGRAVLAGVCLAASVLTGLYATAAVCAVLAIGLFRTVKFGAVQAMVTGCLVAVGNAICYRIGGDNFVVGVYAFHGLKKAKDHRLMDMFPPLDTAGGESGTASVAWHAVGAAINNAAIFLTRLPIQREFGSSSGRLWVALGLVPVVAGGAWLLSDHRCRGGWSALAFVNPRRLWWDANGSGDTGTLAGRTEAVQGDRHGPADGTLLLPSVNRHSGVLWFWLVGVATCLLYSSFKRLYGFYFVILYPFAAACFGYLVEVGLVADNIAEANRQGRRRFTRSPWCAVVAGFFVIVAVCGGWELLAQHYTAVGNGRERGQAIPYDFMEAANGEAWFGRLVREFVWRPFRRAGGCPAAVDAMLWGAKRPFDSIHETAQWIAERSAGTNETLTGSSLLAPTLALLSGQRLAADIVDTNTKRFSAGLTTEREFWTAVCADNVRFVVAGPSSYFPVSAMSKRRTTRRWFARAKAVRDLTVRYKAAYVYEVWERVGSGRCRFEDGRRG